MKTVILCGGLGTRLAEETEVKPKPMVAIGGYPILWHIMKLYSFHGYNEFCLPLGYKGEVIKEYFMNYCALSNDCRVDLKTGEVERLAENTNLDWQVDMIDTGTATLTGGRLHRLQHHLRGEKTFMLTYGDGVANVNINAILDFHLTHKKIATVTAVRPPARFGTMNFDGERVSNFSEKPQTGEGWINGGFFIFNQEIFSYLSGDETVLEGEPLTRLAEDGELMAYKHDGFWQCMDTLRDKNLLCEYWQQNNAPWKLWE